MPGRPSTSSSRLRSCRGEAVAIVLYALGALVAVAAGAKFLRWDPTKDLRSVAAEKKLAEAEAGYLKATAAAQAAQQALQQQSAGIAGDARLQTQAAQSLVAATGQALAAAPADIRGDLHVSAALQTTTLASNALAQAVGPLSQAQLAEVTRLVAHATAASEARRAQAAEELNAVKQQLAAEQQDKERHRTLLQQAEARWQTAEQNAADTRTALEERTTRLQQVLTQHDGLGRTLERFFLWLKIGLGVYLLIAYVLPLVSHFLPGLRALSDLGHAVLTPFAHQEKNGVEALARDASAATDELLELIAQRAPDALKEAHERAGAWITDYDGVRARFEQMLKLAHRR